MYSSFKRVYLNKLKWYFKSDPVKSQLCLVNLFHATQKVQQNATDALPWNKKYGFPQFYNILLLICCKCYIFAWHFDREGGKKWN